MSYLFTDYPDFNGNVAGWNVSKVNNFEAMFSGCESFEGNGIETWEGIVDTKLNYPKGIARNYSEMFSGCESFDASEKCEDWQPHNGKIEWGIIVVDGKDAVEQGLVQDKYDFPSLDEVEDEINNEGSAYIDGEEFSSVEEVKDYYISVWDNNHPDENDILEYLEEYWENTFDSCIDIPVWYDIEEVDYHYTMGGGQSYMR
jgi:hypothetical protein